MGREWRFAAHKTTGRLNVGAMSSDEYPYTPAFNEDTHRLRVYLADPDQPNEAQVTLVNIDKAKEHLGWEPKISFDEGVGKTITNLWERHCAEKN